jgi:hypothetical protein
VVTQEGTALCICNDGYHTDPENAANCIDTTNACADITCGGHGKCAVTQEGTATCICDDGYHTEPENAANCVEIPNTCADVTCGGHGKCAVAQDETAVCICDNGYKPDPKKAANCIINHEVGEIIVFGHYEQDISTTGKEPIEWRVFEVNKSSMLIISEKVLDVKPYYTENGYIDWDKSTIRSWLNGYPDYYNKAGNDYTSDNFIDTAFTAEEKARILSSDVYDSAKPQNGTYTGNATYDKIFLLSIAEAYNYFTGMADRKADATNYAISKGVKVSGSTTDNTCTSDHCFTSWWLRSPGSYAYFAMRILIDGDVYRNGDQVGKNYGVRPAMWVQF